MSLQIRSGYVGSAIMFVASLVIIFLAVYLTKKGTIKPKIRRLTGVDALDEAIGRATEMGRPVILAEAGYRAGAIQIAGTTNSYQIPFFIAACDYTLISEELITAGAYVSKNPEQIGTIFGQDIIRVIGLILTIIGLILWFAGDKTFYTWLMT